MISKILLKFLKCSNPVLNEQFPDYEKGPKKGDEVDVPKSFIVDGWMLSYENMPHLGGNLITNVREGDHLITNCKSL